MLQSVPFCLQRSCPLARVAHLLSTHFSVLHLRSLPASFHRSSACHFFRRAPASYFSSFQLGCLLQPSLHPYILRDAAVPSIAPIGRGFCHTAVTTLSSVFACVPILLLLLQLDSCRPKTAHTGSTPQEQGREKGRHLCSRILQSLHSIVRLRSPLLFFCVLLSP